MHFLFWGNFVKFQKNINSTNLAGFTENKYPTSPTKPTTKYPKSVFKKQLTQVFKYCI